MGYLFTMGPSVDYPASRTFVRALKVGGNGHPRQAAVKLDCFGQTLSRIVKPICPTCNQELAAGNINVAKDVAFCRTCNQALVLSELVRRESASRDVDFNQPPPGAWHRTDGIETIAGATNRSLGTAAGALVFGLFWNGIVSFFVLVALKGTLDHLHLPSPSWFPAAASHGVPSPVGLILFLWVFLTPFIAVGLLMISTFFSSLWGRTELRAGGDEGVVFTGVGNMGFRRRFRCADVRDVRIVEGYSRNSNGYTRPTESIVIETKTGKPIKFGSQLTYQRRRFLAAAAASALLA